MYFHETGVISLFQRDSDVAVGGMESCEFVWPEKLMGVCRARLAMMQNRVALLAEPVNTIIRYLSSRV